MSFASLGPECLAQAAGAGTHLLGLGCVVHPLVLSMLDLWGDPGRSAQSPGIALPAADLGPQLVAPVGDAVKPVGGGAWLKMHVTGGGRFLRILAPPRSSEM